MYDIGAGDGDDVLLRVDLDTSSSSHPRKVPSCIANMLANLSVFSSGSSNL